MTPGSRFSRAAASKLIFTSMRITSRHILSSVNGWRSLTTGNIMLNSAQAGSTRQYKTLKVEHRQTSAVITMNRPEIHNAMDATLMEELTAVFRSKLPINVRAIILTGAGHSFSAGADLSWMRSMKGYSREQNVQDSDRLFQLFYSMHEQPLPIIARVNGAALGGGVGLVAASDIAVGIESAMFGLTEVRLGLAPAVISKWVLDKIGKGAASRYWLTGDRFDAKKAHAIGLLNEAYADIATVDASIETLVKSFSSSSPAAVAATKKLIQQSASFKTIEETRNYTTNLIATLRVSDEGQEGLNAFFEKRKPAWMTNLNTPSQS